MTTLTVEHPADPDLLASLREARHDFLDESEDGTDRWVQAKGPFRRYERQLSVHPDSGRVTETTSFSLDIPIWRPIFTIFMKRALADTDRTPRQRLWWSRTVLSNQVVRLLSALSVLSIMTGYLGVLIGQTITFASEEFGVGDNAQARTLAAIRIGIIVSVIAIRKADVIGRRPLLLGFTVGALTFSLATAFVPSLIWLGVTQGIARGFTTGLITLLILSATEEVPAESRALGISLMAIAAGFGAFLVQPTLVLADTGIGGWRWSFLLSGLFIPVVVWAAAVLPETTRYTVAADEGVVGIIDRSRFILVAGSAFLSALFLSPASQLLNEYLRDDLSWTGSEISLFRIVTGTPVGIVVIAAGLIADRAGRKPIGSVGLAIGTGASLAVFFLTGAALWVMSALGLWLLAAATPALRGYQTELFPTRARARVGGWVDLIAVTGSAIGLLLVGELAERWDSLGWAIAVLTPGPLIVAGLVLFVYPETAAVELEVFNPDDPEFTP